MAQLNSGSILGAVGNLFFIAHNCQINAFLMAFIASYCKLRRYLNSNQNNSTPIIIKRMIPNSLKNCFMRLSLIKFKKNMAKLIKHGPEFVNDELSNKNITRMLWWFIGFISGIIAYALMFNETKIV